MGAHITADYLSSFCQTLAKDRTPSKMPVPKDHGQFNAAHRPVEIFQAQLKSMFEPLVVDNFLSATEVKALLDHYHSRSLSNYNTRQGVTEKKVGWGDVERQILTDKIIQLTGRCDVLSGTYHKLQKPYTPHADLGKDLRLFPYGNVLLPLETEPYGPPTHLVIFHQRYFGFSSTFCAAPREKPPHQNYNQNVTEYSKVMGTSGASFDTQEHIQWLSHCLLGDLEGFTISHVIPWKVGSLVLFDPTHIHASANFLKDGIFQKTALTLSLGITPFSP